MASSLRRGQPLLPNSSEKKTGEFRPGVQSTPTKRGEPAGRGASAPESVPYCPNKNSLSLSLSLSLSKNKTQGGRAQVTDAVIRVRVTARGVPDLTLVDLPGLARVAVEGQSRDVPALTRARRAPASFARARMTRKGHFLVTVLRETIFAFFGNNVP